MILDLHTHSIKSDDGRAKVENYCQWIRKKELPLDGFVLTEHRQFDAVSDYSTLAQQYGLVILKGSEVETDYGHVLVFGVTPELQGEFDFARIDTPLTTVLSAASATGAVAVPCHPGRTNVGMFSHYERKGPVQGVTIVETCNGGSRTGEDEWSTRSAEEFGYLGIGGSDSHIVSRVGFCATEFPTEIASIDQLVDALKGGQFAARSFRDDSRSETA